MVNRLLLLGTTFFILGSTGAPNELLTTRNLPLIHSLFIEKAEFDLALQSQKQHRSFLWKDNLEDTQVVFKKSTGSLQDAPINKSTKWIPGGETALNIFLLYILFRLKRHRRQRQVEWLKRRISADLHDEFGSRLTNIQFLSTVSEKGVRSDLEWQTHLNRIGVEVSFLSESLNEIVWNLNRSDENLEELIAKMRRYSEESMESFGFSCAFDIGSDFQGRKMRMTKRSVLVMVYKEMLNNIRKHSRATEVHILISEKESSLHLVIEDNGVGFDPFKRTDRNGIRNAFERIRRVKGSLDIASKFNIGSRIEILIPFDNTGLWPVFVSRPSFKKIKFISNH